VIKIRQLFLRPAACLISTLLETGVSANDCKYSRDQQLNEPSEGEGTRDDKFWSLDERCLLSFRDRVLSALTAGQSGSSNKYILPFSKYAPSETIH
jgi:hypothetical protein